MLPSFATPASVDGNRRRPCNACERHVNSSGLIIYTTSSGSFSFFYFASFASHGPLLDCRSASEPAKSGLRSSCMSTHWPIIYKLQDFSFFIFCFLYNFTFSLFLFREELILQESEKEYFIPRKPAKSRRKRKGW